MTPSTNSSEITIVVNGEALRVALPETSLSGEIKWLFVEGRPYEVSFDRSLHWLKTPHGLYRVDIHDLQTVPARPRSGDGRVKAPIPGLITRVLVTVGQPVEAGQPLMMLEAMKMENEIRSPCAGTVSAVQAAPGQAVVRAEVLAEIT